MREIKKALRSGAAGDRRWFNSETADLFVWEKHGRVCAFEYSYDKPHDEHVLSWHEKSGFRHMRVDDGESNPLQNQAPLLLAGQPYNISYVWQHFRHHAVEVDSSIFLFVLEKMDEAL